MLGGWSTVQTRDYLNAPPHTLSLLCDRGVSTAYWRWRVGLSASHPVSTSVQWASDRMMMKVCGVKERHRCNTNYVTMTELRRTTEKVWTSTVRDVRAACARRGERARARRDQRGGFRRLCRCALSRPFRNSFFHVSTTLLRVLLTSHYIVQNYSITSFSTNTTE